MIVSDFIEQVVKPMEGEFYIGSGNLYFMHVRIANVVATKDDHLGATVKKIILNSLYAQEYASALEHIEIAQPVRLAVKHLQALCLIHGVHIE